MLNTNKSDDIQTILINKINKVTEEYLKHFSLQYFVKDEKNYFYL